MEEFQNYIAFLSQIDHSENIQYQKEIEEIILDLKNKVIHLCEMKRKVNKFYKNLAKFIHEGVFYNYNENALSLISHIDIIERIDLMNHDKDWLWLKDEHYLTRAGMDLLYAGQQETGIKLLRIAAKENGMEASILLGMLYRNGWAGIKKDVREGIKWHKHADAIYKKMSEQEKENMKFEAEVNKRIISNVKI